MVSGIKNVIAIVSLAFVSNAYPCALDFHLSMSRWDSTHNNSSQPLLIALDHPSFIFASVGEEHEVAISYQVLFLGNKVSLAFEGTRNIEFIDNTADIDAMSGLINTRFKLTEPGYDSITITAKSMYMGQQITTSSTFFVRAENQAKTVERQLQLTSF